MTGKSAEPFYPDDLRPIEGWRPEVPRGVGLWARPWAAGRKGVQRAVCRKPHGHGAVHRPGTRQPPTASRRMRDERVTNARRTRDERATAGRRLRGTGRCRAAAEGDRPVPGGGPSADQPLRALPDSGPAGPHRAKGAAGGWHRCWHWHRHRVLAPGTGTGTRYGRSNPRRARPVRGRSPLPPGPAPLCRAATAGRRSSPRGASRSRGRRPRRC